LHRGAMTPKVPMSLQQMRRHLSEPEPWLHIDSDLAIKCNCSASVDPKTS
jgi:hypothetical protein